MKNVVSAKYVNAAVPVLFLTRSEVSCSSFVENFVSFFFFCLLLSLVHVRDVLI